MAWGHLCPLKYEGPPARRQLPWLSSPATSTSGPTSGRSPRGFALPQESCGGSAARVREARASFHWRELLTSWHLPSLVSSKRMESVPSPTAAGLRLGACDGGHWWDKSPVSGEHPPCASQTPCPAWALLRHEPELEPFPARPVAGCGVSAKAGWRAGLTAEPTSQRTAASSRQRKVSRRSGEGSGGG